MISTLKKAQYLLAGLAVLAPVLMAESAAALDLKYAHQSAVTHPFHLSGEFFAKDIAERSNNAVTMRVFPAAQLGSAQKALEGILLGNVDVTAAGSALLASFVPEFNVLNMPFLFRDAEHFDKVLERGSPVSRKLEELASARGFRYLCMFTAGERHFLSKEPLKSIEDLNGLKIRSIENPAYIAAFTAFGANPIALAYPELYGALQTGVIDGADAAPTNYMSEKFFEVAPNFALVNWITFANTLVMSEAKFQALSDADKDAVIASADATCSFEREMWRQSDQDRLEEMRAMDLTITELDPKPFQAASKIVYDEFLTSEFELELLKMIQEM